MLEAITYTGMLQNIKENLAKYELSEDLIGILLTRPELESAKSILPSLSYYHHRTGSSVNFYLPGFGAYWGDIIPDRIDVALIDGVQWSFCNKLYVDFLDEIEINSKWKYSGESELLLLGFRNQTIDFSQVVELKLDIMLRENVIESIPKFFEDLIREIKKSTGAATLSNRLGVKLAKQLTLDGILNILPKICKDIFTKGKHYIVSNLAN